MKIKWILLCFAALPAGAQDDHRDSFSRIKDHTIKRELASFVATAELEGDVKPLKVRNGPSVNCKKGALLQLDSFQVQIGHRKFDPTKHQITRKDNLVQTIDGEHVWGRDGDLPMFHVSGLVVKNGDQAVRIPASALEALYEPNFCSAAIYSSGDGKRMYVYMMNGDGAGGYEVAWIFVNRKYFGRMVDYGF
ncbi:hypothetical protein ACWKWU_04915 [Chitinophaga lutea]